MKLLIITQVIDTEHPILGFFHRWIQEFAKHCDHVHIICLQEGSRDLPDNVTVHSLGKESGASRLTYLWRFYKLIWQLRHEYDNVFVHMNQVYVILGAPLWRPLGKRVGLWYMHGTVSRSLKLAEKLVQHIFTGSPESCRLASQKIIVTGHGIDTTHFAPDLSVTKSLDLITVGRITPAKNLMQLVDILHTLRQTIDVTLTIVGAPVTAVEEQYTEKLKQHIDALGLDQFVHFPGRVPQTDLPALLNSARVFVTVAQNGSLDKAILEAMAVGLPVVSSAPGSDSLPLGTNQVSTPAGFVDQLQKVLQSTDEKPVTNAMYVKENHSIASLVPKILNTY